MRTAQPLKILTMTIQTAQVLAEDWMAHPGQVGASLEANHAILRSATLTSLQYLWTTLVRVVPCTQTEVLGHTLLDAVGVGGAQDNKLSRLLWGSNLVPGEPESVEHALRSWPILRSWAKRKSTTGVQQLVEDVADFVLTLAYHGQAGQALLDLVLSEVDPKDDGTDPRRLPWVHRWLDRGIKDAGSGTGAGEVLDRLRLWSVNVDALNEWGRTALEELALRQNIDDCKSELMTLLLEAGANWQDLEHPTARAIVREHPYVKRLLLGAEATDASVRTPAPRGRL